MVFHALDARCCRVGRQYYIVLAVTQEVWYVFFMKPGVVRNMIMSLDKRRREAKLSRRKWLAKAGVAESTYYNWLREIYTPRVVTLEKLRQAIDGPNR